MRRGRSVAVAAFLIALVGEGARATESLPPPGQANSHEAYARTVRSAEWRAYGDALAVFDARLRRAPDDVVAAVERCKLIGGLLPNDEDAAADDDDGDGPAREASFDDCVQMLEQRFPRATPVLAYRLSRKWGDEAIALANEMLADRRLAWSDRERASIYEKLARSYVFTKHNELGAEAAERAMALDSKIDLAEIVATEWLAEGRASEAIVALSARTDGTPYSLTQKAKLLADAGASSRALWMLDLAKKRGAYVDPSLHAKLLERVGKLDLARREYAEMKGPWKRNAALTHVFELDLAGSDAASAAQSYQALRDLGWRVDPFGGYRLALARKFRGVEWRRRDWVGVLGFGLLLLSCLLLPGLWVIPIHYWSLWRRLRGPLVEQPRLATRWRFREIWMASTGFLIVEMICLELFDYGELASWMRPAADRLPSSASALAAYGMWHAALLTVMLAAILVRRRDLRLFGPGAWSVWRSIGGAAAVMGVVAVVGLMMILVARAFGGNALPVSGAITTETVIAAVRQVYGIGGVIVVAIIVAPITEELVFRSVMLDVFAKYTPFLVANGMQALLFAAAHGEISRMPYLFAVGLAAGWLRRRSGGLLPSITLHAMNNTLAMIMLLAFTTPTAATTPSPRPVHRAPPVTVSAELAACMRATHGRDALPPEALSQSSGMQAASLLNRAAWAMAMDPATSPACLRTAEEAANGALRRAPEEGNILDTKATVYYREGRFDEAVDLERAAIERQDHRAWYSQLDRFLRARRTAGAPPLIGSGAAAVVQVALEPARGNRPQAISVQLGDQFNDGVYLYALVTSANQPVGVVRAVFGPGHATSYRMQPQEGVLLLPDDAHFDVALLDARGCDGCARGQWHWEFQVHDAAVDAYAR